MPLFCGPRHALPACATQCSKFLDNLTVNSCNNPVFEHTLILQQSTSCAEDVISVLLECHYT